MKKVGKTYIFESEEEKNLFIGMIKEDTPNKRIASQFGISECAVNSLAKRAGIDMKQVLEERKKKKINMFLDMYRKGNALKVICDVSHVTLKTGRNIIKVLDPSIKLELDREREKAKKNANVNAEYKSIYGESDKEIIDYGKLRALHNAGWSDPKIADEFGVTTSEVDRCLRILNIR